MTDEELKKMIAATKAVNTKYFIIFITFILLLQQIAEGLAKLEKRLEQIEDDQRAIAKRIQQLEARTAQRTARFRKRSMTPSREFANKKRKA